MNITDLNDDCLYQICSYLSIHDMVELHSTCTRFAFITDRFFSTQRHLIIGMRTAQLDKMDRLLQCIGAYLTSVTIWIGYLMPENMVLPILLPVSKFCTNLKRLTVNFMKMEVKYKKLLMAVTSNVEFLDISCCDIDDDDADLLLSCKKVKTLTLNGNDRFRGLCLPQLTSLKHLIAKHSTGIHHYILEELRKRNVKIDDGT
ncbi:unnamed protein product [Hermetia illucens]|uniref:F-box domain-containing protein n=1 Tax=Hermetia illucens TaxID=343691 RepID=A0A7R8UXV4_HERIL|nr:uncharacterized protein LOC119654333 [Hermetia illucens]XP_037915593.1 uncharacterized protein LOC119654333 [Hermetia illucens]CAD7089038.1 unnamed protein product [Hermetia illucens]